MFDRRRLLKGATLLAGLGAFGAPALGGLLGLSGPAGAAVGGPLRDPPEVRARDGVLCHALTLRYADIAIGTDMVHLRSYDGRIPAPTLRLRAGDSLRLTVHNRLPPNPDLVLPQGMTREAAEELRRLDPKALELLCLDTVPNVSIPHYFNNTNVHFHGLHASPNGQADNVLMATVPGESFENVVELPANQPEGLYWYHPHRHGAAAVQVSSGMAGAIVVEGPLDEVPEVKAARERMMVFQWISWDSDNRLESFDVPFLAYGAKYIAINGQVMPEIHMRPGEVQRWRMVHAGNHDFALLGVQGHRLTVLAYDGNTLATPAVEERILFASGMRADVLIRAGAAGSYDLMRYRYDQSPVFQPPDYDVADKPIARVIVSGEPMAMGLPDALPVPALLKPIADAEIRARRTLTFTDIESESGRWQDFSFTIDNRPFDPGRVDHWIPLGTAEEWHLVNASGQDHPFHIHVDPFEIVAVDGRPLSPGLWRDTVPVPKNGSVTIRHRFLDFPGTFVLHCHILNHEDLGMMQVVEVYDPEDPEAVARMNRALAAAGGRKA